MDKRKIIQRIFEFVIDLIAICAANFVSMVICILLDKIPPYTINEASSYAICLFFAFALVFFGFFSPLDLTKRSRVIELISVLRNCLLTYMVLSVFLILTRNQLLYGRYFFLLSLAFYILISSFNRYILKRVMIYRFSNSKLVSLVGVITVGNRAESIISALADDWVRRIEGVVLLDSVFENGVYKYRYPKKVIDENGKSVITCSDELETVREISGVEVVANKDNFIDWVRSASLDEVFINIPISYEEYFADIIDELESMGLTVHINMPALEKQVQESRFNNIECSMLASYPTATLRARKPIPLRSQVFKRLIDIAFGTIGTVISLPIILLVAIPLKLESKGPLIFKQPRVGRNGRVFNIYKLRSMYIDAEERKAALMSENKVNGFMFKMDNDPRITKVGRFIRKTSIDELPQFWNVLKGDMSLIGTRPPTVDEFEQYESHHKRRLSMRPGITGMWQVSGRSNIQDFEDVVSLDVEYIDHWSFWLDFKIFLKTIIVVLKGSGAE